MLMSHTVFSTAAHKCSTFALLLNRPPILSLLLLIKDLCRSGLLLLAITILTYHSPTIRLPSLPCSNYLIRVLIVQLACRWELVENSSAVNLCIKSGIVTEFEFLFFFASQFVVGRLNSLDFRLRFD